MIDVHVTPAHERTPGFIVVHDFDLTAMDLTEEDHIFATRVEAEAAAEQIWSAITGASD
jgi:hypothetical protein